MFRIFKQALYISSLNFFTVVHSFTHPAYNVHILCERLFLIVLSIHIHILIYFVGPVVTKLVFAIVISIIAIVIVAILFLLYKRKRAPPGKFPNNKMINGKYPAMSNDTKYHV